MRKYHLWLIIIIWLGLALRLYNLTYHSLWFDEAISVHWARQSVPRILEVGFTLEEDRLPPLYYLTLKGWSGLFGLSEWSVRLLSVLFGTLLLPVGANLAAMLFNRRVALLAAGLLSLNPFLIWYAQEARMYAPAVFFGTLAVWAWLRLGRSLDSGTGFPPPVLRRTFYVALFILAATAGLYSHLYVGFLLPALGLWLLLSYPRRWRWQLLFGFSGLLISLAYGPILQAIWRFSGQATPGAPLSGFWGRAWRLLESFTVWQAPLSPPLDTLIPAIIALFALLAFLPRPAARSSRSHALRENAYRPASRANKEGRAAPPQSPPQGGRKTPSPFGRGLG